MAPTDRQTGAATPANAILPVATDPVTLPAGEGVPAQSQGCEIADTSIEDLIRRLASDGYAIAPGLLPSNLVTLMRTEAITLDRRAATALAGIGRQHDLTHDQAVRQTRICWFDGSSPGQSAFNMFAERLRLAINRRLFMGLFEFEAQYAIYPGGGFYARHLDSFAGARNRMVSLVAYLNPNWRETDGGLLRLWQPGGAGDERPQAVVTPQAGTVVLMLSEEVPHEVTEALRERISVAGWFRVNQSLGGRIDPPK